MIKIIGKGVMEPFSQEIPFEEGLRVRDLPQRLKMPAELSEELVVVRNFCKLDDADLIHDLDEVRLFLQLMGG